MAELPRYVKVQRKGNGRTFHYYEKHRGTANAWPRLAILAPPSDPEFWRRCSQCERLVAVKSEAGWGWSLAGIEGRSHALPSPADGTAAFWEAVDAAEVRERQAAAGEARTFSALIRLFKASEVYGKLSASSRGDYDRYLGVIEDAWGDDPVRNLIPVGAQEAIDDYAQAPDSGRYFRAVLQRLVAYGIPRGYASANVVEHTEKPSHDPQPYKPWPTWALELFLTHARVGLHLPVYSALYTGQRKVDVLAMMRPRNDAKAIELVARKTGAQVYVPIHSEYRQVIAAARADHVSLHLREDGDAWTYHGFTTAWQRELSTSLTPAEAEAATPAQREFTAAMARLREAGMVFHGLRKNAVNMLLEVGCTEAQVSALVEMSEQMVRHYARDVDKRRLAVEAMKKLEDGWSEARLRLFGGTAANG